MKLKFAYSPCPNDTFMFEPIYSKRIDTLGLDFEIIHDEVEQLNNSAFHRKYDISKLSFNAFAEVSEKYQLLSSGSALGEGCGPILVAKRPIALGDLKDYKIAIPGVNTTANLMMSLALPEVKNKVEIVFSEIESAISEGRVDAGLLIHESRFTYQSNGLQKLLDVGQFWEDETNSPIPLGGIAIARDLPAEIKQKVNKVISDSVHYAFQNPRSGLDYISKYAQEMEEAVMYSHIELYVNEYSKNLGYRGRQSIKTLFEKKGIKPFKGFEALFID